VAKVEKAMEKTSFWGQIASVYVFDDVLTPSQIQAIFELGSNYTSQFLSEDLEIYPKSQVLFDGSVRSKLFLNFNPKASKGNSCVDLSRRHAKPVHGELTQVFKSVTLKFRNIIHAQGGMKSLFPLILQIDSRQIGDSTHHLAVTTLQLFKALLFQSPRNQEDLVSKFVFPLLFLSVPGWISHLLFFKKKIAKIWL